MKNKVILCGSMKVKDKIIEVKETLENKGFLVILPEECFKDEKIAIAYPWNNINDELSFENENIT